VGPAILRRAGVAKAAGFVPGSVFAKLGEAARLLGSWRSERIESQSAVDRSRRGNPQAADAQMEFCSLLSCPWVWLWPAPCSVPVEWFC